MSYILEALQRADQERRRTQAIAMPSVVGDNLDHAASSGVGRWFGWAVAIVLLVLLVLLLLLVWLQHSPAPPPASPQQQTRVAAAQVVVKPSPPRQPTQPVAIVKVPTVVTPLPKQATEAKVAPVQSAATSLASTPIALTQLPFLVRQALPKIHISALIDHQDPARRVAWINDRSRHIGEWITASVRLIAISERDITLEFQGYQIVITPFQ